MLLIRILREVTGFFREGSGSAFSWGKNLDPDFFQWQDPNHVSLDERIWIFFREEDPDPGFSCKGRIWIFFFREQDPGQAFLEERIPFFRGQDADPLFWGRIRIQFFASEYPDSAFLGKDSIPDPFFSDPEVRSGTASLPVFPYLIAESAWFRCRIYRFKSWTNQREAAKKFLR